MLARIFPRAVWFVSLFNILDSCIDFSILWIAASLECCTVLLKILYQSSQKNVHNFFRVFLCKVWVWITEKFPKRPFLSALNSWNVCCCREDCTVVVWLWSFPVSEQTFTYLWLAERLPIAENEKQQQRTQNHFTINHAPGSRSHNYTSAVLNFSLQLFKDFLDDPFSLMMLMCWTLMMVLTSFSTLQCLIHSF